MGEVFVAHDTRLGRVVALKLIPAELARSASLRDRFEREARALAALNHPNVVTIYSVEEAGGMRFLTMELVRGTPLTAVLEAGPLPTERLLNYARQIARGLEGVHRAGVIHRDLKPDNLMVSVEDTIKILDFGLAKHEGPPGAPAQGSAAPTRQWSDTAPGLPMGTAPYMSPEQALGKPLDERTDLFALGVVIYQMATGRSPFHQPTLAATFDSVLNRSPTPPLEVNPALPAGLPAIIERALQKDRERRHT